MWVFLDTGAVQWRKWVGAWWWAGAAGEISTTGLGAGGYWWLAFVGQKFDLKQSGIQKQGWMWMAHFGFKGKKRCIGRGRGYVMSPVNLSCSLAFLLPTLLDFKYIYIYIFFVWNWDPSRSRVGVFNSCGSPRPICPLLWKKERKKKRERGCVLCWLGLSRGTLFWIKQ